MCKICKSLPKNKSLKDKERKEILQAIGIAMEAAKGKKLDHLVILIDKILDMSHNLKDNSEIDAIWEKQRRGS